MRVLDARGGLLIACAPSAAGDVLDLLRRGGHVHAACIGSLAAGASEITVAA